MKRSLSRRYQAALLTYLRHPSVGRLQPAQRVGQQASNAGVPTLEVARLHEQILLSKVLPGRSPKMRDALIHRAGTFFSSAITAIKAHPSDSRHPAVQLNDVIAMLSHRTVELAALNLKLEGEIAHRKTAEDALKKSERHYSQLLARSDNLQDQLRQLSRQILSAQEDERKRISRELHDVIAQTLTGINLRLATLKKEASVNIKGLDGNIARTQRLVEQSVDIVHRFARELRPAVLDELGLVPALHSFLKSFAEQTGIRTHLTASAGIINLTIAPRTALFRVAQEALTNVARHAQATRVAVNVERQSHGIALTIEDDGKSFSVKRTMSGAGSKHLGLLGMKERLEMVGGRLEIKSAPGAGTVVRAEIPSAKPRPSRRRSAQTLIPIPS